MTRHEPAISAPAFLRKWQVWAFLMVLFLFPFFIKIPRALNHHPVISPIGDQVHIFLFGGITLLLYWFGPLQGRLWRAAAVSAILGGAVEFLQLLVGRQALFQDFLLDLVGIGLVVGFILWRGHRNQAGKWIFILLLVSIPVQLYYLPWRIAAAYRVRDIFPVLADFEKYQDRYLWAPNMEGKISFHHVEDSPGGPGTVMRLYGDDDSNWPGTAMRRFPEDWSGYTELKFEARIHESARDTLRFSIRLDDYEGVREEIWLMQSFKATREWRTYSLVIRDRRLFNTDRILELGEMDRLIFYYPRPKEPGTLEFDNIRLE
jgi:VanZ family protein